MPSGPIEASQQFTLEAFISDLPVELRGYQIGLEITGGLSGTITAAAFEDSRTTPINPLAAPHGFFRRSVAALKANCLVKGLERAPLRVVSRSAGYDLPAIDGHSPVLVRMGNFSMLHREP